MPREQGALGVCGTIFAETVSTLDTESPKGREASVCEKEPNSGAPVGVPVHLSGLLQLSSPELETSFWQSPAAVRLLRVSDLFCLSNAVFTSLMLIRTFGTGSQSGMSWHYQLPMVLYAFMNVTQLGVLLLAPQLFQQRRFQLTLLSRCLRLVGVAWCAYHTGSSDMARMLGSIDNKRAVTGTHMSLLRSLIVPPMTAFNHGQYLLPFVYVLPAQLWTFAACAWTLRLTACLLEEDKLQLSRQVCEVLRSVMYNLSMVRPSQGAQECRDVQGLLMLALYLHVILLILVPCLAVYWIELKLKVAYIRSEGYVLQHVWLLNDSALYKAVMAYAAVVSSWMVCEVAVLLAAPLQCTDQGLLHWAVAQQ